MENLGLSTAVILDMVLKGKWQVIISLMIVGPLIYWTYIINLVQHPAYRKEFNSELEKVVQKLGINPVEINLHSTVQDCGLLQQVDYNDKISLDQRQAYLSQSFRILASHISNFNLLPTSTLHTYLDQNIYIFFKECNWPFEIIPQNILHANLENSSDIVPFSAIINEGTTWKGSDYYKSNLSDLRVIGSYYESDAAIGELQIRLNRGDSLLYRSGPIISNQSLSIIGNEQAFVIELPIALDWVILKFSIASLPDEFIVKINDQGQGWEEWSAIAVRN